MARKTTATPTATKPPAAPKAALVARPPRGDSRGQITVLPAGLAVVEALAAEGVNIVSIAKRLGVSPTAFREIRRRQPEVDDAYETGHAALDDSYAKKFRKWADKGNVTAAIFYAKCKLGWREKDDPTDTRPNVIIALPDALSPAEFMRVVSPSEATPALPAPVKKDVVR